MAAKKLSDKQAVFVTEYLLDLNATAAARRAGYSEKYADRIGSQLLGKTRVQEAISAALEERKKRVEISQDWVVERLRENVERSMQIISVLDSEGEPIGEYSYQGSVANKSLELLGRHIGMWANKVEHTGGLRMEIVEEIVEAEPG